MTQLSAVNTKVAHDSPMTKSYDNMIQDSYLAKCKITNQQLSKLAGSNHKA